MILLPQFILPAAKPNKGLNRIPGARVQTLKNEIRLESEQSRNDIVGNVIYFLNIHGDHSSLLIGQSMSNGCVRAHLNAISVAVSAAPLL
nr:hypothetical protein SHINE37_100209 [Rhizobiaceae bacterium]